MGPAPHRLRKCMRMTADPLDSLSQCAVPDTCARLGIALVERTTVPGKDAVLALDLGGTKLTAAIIDTNLDRRHVVHREIAGLEEYGEVFRAAVECAATLAASHPEVAGIGLAVAGQVDERAGTVSHRAIKRGEAERGIAALAVQRYPLAELIALETKKPTFVENDGNAAVLAEWKAGAARGKDNVVLLTDDLRAFVTRWRLPGADERGPEITLSRWGAQSGLVGAAVVAFERLGLPFTPEGTTIGVPV